MKTRRLLMAVAVAVLSAGAASAQPPGAQQPSDTMYLNRLHSDLGLNQAQESAWQAFQQAYRVDPRDMAQEREAEQRMPSLTGPQRMDLAIQMAEQDLAGMRRRGEALKAFYATLSPEQQRTFDRDTLSGPGPGSGP